MTQNDVNELKKLAAYRAVEWVESGMVVGLGHGSTAIHAVRRIGERLAEGTLKDIRGVPCSREIEAEAQKIGIPLTTLDETPIIDLTIDGADEVDPALNLIKGGGGALLREKIVAQASRREIIVVDPSKIVAQLGTQWAVPVEVVEFGWRAQQRFLERLGAVVKVRQAHNEIFKTDSGNLILDCKFAGIADAYALSRTLKDRAGIVEHGLFLDLATDVIIAARDGIQHRRRSQQGEGNL